MQDICLEFFTEEDKRHDGRLVHEWLLDLALGLGLPGGSVFRTIAGYGRHHRKYDQDHVELQGRLPMAIVFALSEAQGEQLLQHLQDAKLDLFYMRTPVEYGYTGG